MSRVSLCLSVCLLLAAASSASAQTIVTTPERQEDRAFTLTIMGGNFLGVTTEAVTKETMSRYGLTGEPRGLAVLSVAENSPAARAGLQKGDVILRFDGEEVSSVAKLQRLIAEAAPEHAVRLTVSRGGAQQELTATLARRGSFEGFPHVEGFALRDGEAFKLDGDEWKRFGEEWRAHGEEWRKQMEEMRQQFDKLPKGNNVFVLGATRRIGVTTSALTDQLADYFGLAGRGGLLVTSVSDNSPAARAGLRAGDIITDVDGEQVKAAGDLVRALNRRDDGDVTLGVTRDRKARTVRVTPERVQPSTFFGPDGPLPPPVAFTIPRAEVRLPRVITPRVITPRVIMPRLVVPRVRITPRAMTIRSTPVIL
jgi:serine protease Do